MNNASKTSMSFLRYRRPTCRSPAELSTCLERGEIGLDGYSVCSNQKQVSLKLLFTLCLVAALIILPCLFQNSLVDATARLRGAHGGQRTYEREITQPPHHPIPKNILFNFKDKHFESKLIERNVERIKLAHQDWNVIFDDDESCYRKILNVSHHFSIQGDKLLTWWTKSSVPGKIRSDLCRLAQLYFDGGVYLDNDLDVVVNLNDVVGPRDSFISCWSLPHVDGDGVQRGGEPDGIVFQALMAATKRSSIITRGLDLFFQLINGTLQVKEQDIGTAIMGLALKEREHSSDEGVKMFTEQFVPHDATEMRNRWTDMFCDAAIMDNNNGTVIAFSRVMKITTVSDSCLIKKE
jgi:hypothetical protein